MNKIILLFLSVCLFAVALFSQNEKETISNLNRQIAQHYKLADSLTLVLEDINLKAIRTNLTTFGLPAFDKQEDLVEHSGFILLYSPKHKQAKWVAHIIIPDVANSKVSRSNDFREDTLVSGGTATESDYFSKTIGDDSIVSYIGYGYDRGHLVPSADFRWSQKALSETYLYSNISPQLPDFNREIWAELENMLRQYVVENKGVSLYVVTGPVLTDSLPVINESRNQVAVPRYFYKAVYDSENKKSIAFLMPHKKLDYPVEFYAVSIDSLEVFTQIDFFPNLDNITEMDIEQQCNAQAWLPAEQKNDVKPLRESERPKNTHNTVEAKLFVGSNSKECICGTVVSTHLSAKGNIFINLDKSFPNQIFSISIFKKNLINFSYEPQEYLLNKKICIKGYIKEYEGTPGIYPQNEKDIFEIK